MTKRSHNSRGNKKKLAQYLGIEPPFLIIDELIHHQFEKRVESLVYLDPSKWFFQCHFVNNPLMPGHLISEAMIQTASLLIGWEEKSKKEPHSLYVTSSKTSFLKFVKPGGIMRIVAKPVKIISFAAIFSAKAYVGKNKVADGEFISRIINEKHFKNDKRKR